MRIDLRISARYIEIEKPDVFIMTAAGLFVPRTRRNRTQNVHKLLNLDFVPFT